MFVGSDRARLGTPLFGMIIGMKPSDTHDPVMSIYDRVRAGHTDVRPGERHLFAMLSVHNMVCNGGVAHAVLTRSISEISEAAQGARYFGLDELAATFDGMLQASRLEEAYEFEESGPLIDRLDNQYRNAIPQDSIFEDVLLRKLRTAPEDFPEHI